MPSEWLYRYMPVITVLSAEINQRGATQVCSGKSKKVK